MTGDLGATTGEVHDEAAAVLAFWFDEVAPERQFAKDDALDAEIARRFGALREQLATTGAAGWDGDPDMLLAAVIVLDQFSRNLHRGSAEAFATDDLALSLARRAIAAGWDRELPVDRRAFLYLPFMHAKDAGVQEESVRLFTELGRELNLKFAIDHRDVIARFGRYPGRNAALGRETTPEEAAYLSQPGAGW
ncbi:DUF924 family protein [Sphingomonas baiyangensis]|uniref:DUF924 domain-containing protein n=1 Tax=Sphingomonas baiyangensis TaxID=2572576 RepID=A0A4U1L2P0_9SPHN|nr:DUF924 family protein [Sphingomonas baiyangensis]TKD50882.1 DUF924 domain-containing protein [Sphingomonas baiyangensis]